MNFLKRFLEQSPAPKAQHPLTSADRYDLDTPLLYFSPGDAWTIRDAVAGTTVWGATGSGKTSGSGEAIAKAFLRAGFGGLICCAKPDERALFERYAKETGREKHLLIVSADDACPWRFNFLQYELQREGKGGGQTENLVNMFRPYHGDC